MRRSLAFLALAAAGTAAAVAVIGWRLLDRDPETPPELTPHPVQGWSRPLSPDEQTRLEAIARTEPRVGALLAGLPVTRVDVAGFPSSQYYARVGFILDGPHEISGRWLAQRTSAGEFEEGTQAFPSFEFGMTVRGVGAISVWIDLLSQRVFKIEPASGAPNDEWEVELIGTPAPEIQEEIEAWEEKYGPIPEE